jgi:diacylglycerol kinase family enzyme
MAPPAKPTTRQAAVVYNPTKVDLAKLREAVESSERAAGWAPSHWLETTADDPGMGQARSAVEQGADLVLSAGGDGTVRAVAEAVRGQDVSIGLIPLGTGNLLARNLGLDVNSSKLDDAVHTAFTGDDRPIDVGVIEIERVGGERTEHAFLVMAGLGLDAKMIANTRPALKRRVGWLAYVDAIARSLIDRDVLRIRYRLDDEEERATRVHTIMVGNCGTMPGNVVLLPDAQIDDGVFDIVTLRPEGFGGWAVIWFKIFWENGVLRRSQVGRKIVSMQREVRTLRYLRGTSLTVRLDRPEEFELDGDEFGRVIAFRARVDPGAVRVRVPA